MSIDPENVYPPLHLMGVYHTMGRDDLAVSVGDRAMLSLPDDDKNSTLFLLTYGHEQMLTSQVERAQATLINLLNHTTDIVIVNDAAYYLSQQGVGLERAEQALRESLKQFDPEDDGRTQHVFNLSSEEHQSLMFASWDTLGWILFKEGRVADAESFIRAAWRNNPSFDIGQHLGAIYESKDDPGKALDTYHLALAAIPHASEETARTNPDVISTGKAIERLEKQGFVSTIKDPLAELASLQVLDAGPAGKRRGKGEFDFWLKPSSIEIVMDRAIPEELEGPVATLSKTKLPADFFPKDSHAVITRRARLECNKECTLTLLP